MKEQLKVLRVIEKPFEHLNWNLSGSNIERPPQSIIDNGYEVGDVYNPKHHTWIVYTIDLWNKFNEYIGEKNRVDIGNLKGDLNSHNHDDKYAMKDGTTNFPKIIINNVEITVVD